jgi:phenylalanyl-tRNA synthetase alpha chain
MYKLTREGERYLKYGLPEKNLIEFLRKLPRKSEKLETLRKKVPNLHVALKWALDKKLVKLVNGRVKLLKYTKSFAEERALKRIRSGKRVDDKILRILFHRKLVRKVKKIKVKKEVTFLTHEMLKSDIWKKVRFKPYKVEVVGKKTFVGSIHPYQQIIDEIREILVNLGFVEEKGPLVELNFWNCDALFMPSDHPARGIHDIYILKKPKYGRILSKNIWRKVEQTHINGWKTGSKGWGNWDLILAKTLILRSQNTAISARVLSRLKEKDLPYKMFCLGRVFRPDVIDAKHFVEFEQFEGIVVGKDLNLKHLLGYLKEITFALGAKKIRFKPSYFPFTEPSVEAQVFIKGLGWVEIIGAGIFRPEVTLPLGTKYPVLAWGGGLGRLAMVRLGINDIRQLYSTDLEWLRKKVIV